MLHTVLPLTECITPSFLTPKSCLALPSDYSVLFTGIPLCISELLNDYIFCQCCSVFFWACAALQFCSTAPKKVVTSKELLALHDAPAKSRPSSSEAHEDLTVFMTLPWPLSVSQPMLDAGSHPRDDLKTRGMRKRGQTLNFPCGNKMWSWGFHKLCSSLGWAVLPRWEGLTCKETFRHWY